MLIVDMPMPKRCFDCPMHDYVSNRSSSLPSVVRPVCNAHHELTPIPNGNERPDWCPIKGVLPDEHVDLIDRDEMFEAIYSRVALIDSCPEGKPSMKELFERDVLCTCLHDVVCAKAVIAAERKDDEQIH